jgi:dihydrofolate reductase
MAYQGIEIVHVVAMDTKNCIGVNNQLPWHLPDDLKHFKQITQGGVIVMGRKTYDSMGRALPNRVNWVLTRDHTWTANKVKVAHDLNALLDMAIVDVKALGQTSLFIIGGAEIFKQTLPFSDRLEITHVVLDVNGDTFYPAIPQDFIVESRQAAQDSNSQTRFEFVRYQIAPQKS